MLRRPCLLLLLCHAAASALPAATCYGATRTTRFWVGANGAGGVGIVDRGTNASCSAAFLGNLTKHQAAVSSLGFEVWSLGSNGSQPRVAYNDGSTFDPGLAACVKQLAASFPHIKIGLCGATAAGPLSVSLSDPAGYVAALGAFTAGVGFAVDEIWTDFEVKDIGASGAAGANKMHALSQEKWPTFRYAGCEPRDDPYFSENCSAFVAGAPGVVVQAANTYWSTAVSAGWYGGFGALLQQEIDNIGGASNIGALSPAICPDCPTGLDADDALTQEQLYARMDLMCAQGITDVSGFTFFEIAQGPQGDAALGERYFEAFSYFRTGTKRGIA